MDPSKDLIRHAEKSYAMRNNSSILKGKRVGVIGFNARPIAHSLKCLGAQPFVSDYWGDTDLYESSRNCIAVLSSIPGMRQRQPIGLPMHQALIENYMMLTKDIDIDYVIIGSGFDDESESLEQIMKNNFLMGNSIAQIKRARDHTTLDRLARDQHLRRPKEFVTSVDSVRGHAAEIGFPCIIRPLKSGGGKGIRLIRNEKDLESFIRMQMIEGQHIRIQEYISGFDISSSVISTKDEATCISVQGQLIGIPSAGSNCGFRYCGNYYPALISEHVKEQVAKTSEEMCKKLQLIGSNGFDFVIDSSERPYLMEVNPRIQGTLEMLEISSNLSLIQMHILATEGCLPTEEPILRPSVKMIVYSTKRGLVPDLAQYDGVFDRSPIGVVVHRRDPICTVITVGDSLSESYNQAYQTANLIQKSVR